MKNNQKKGLELLNEGNIHEAKIIYEELKNNFSLKYHFHLGLRLINHEKFNYYETLKYLKQSFLNLDEKYHYYIYVEFANIAKIQKKYYLVIKYINKALSINKNNYQAIFNLGNTYKLIGDKRKAITNYEKALKIKKDFIPALHNLSLLQTENGNIDLSIEYYKEIIKIDKKAFDSRFNLGCLYLLKGDYKNGWDEYECRFKKRFPVLPSMIPNLEKWQGEKLKKGDKLLVISEQGLGDTIQFMRYVKFLTEKNIEISFYAQEKLKGIIISSKITKNFSSTNHLDTINCTKWTPLLSLPKWLEVNPQNPIIYKSYVKAETTKLKKWAKILRKESSKIIIGINWQGDLNHEKNNLKGRSMKLEKFKEIFKDLDVDLISLQKGHGSEQLRNCSFGERFLKCQEEINNTWSFSDTAAIVLNCDLIITIDSAMAHLSAALGQKTWVFLKKIPDWRWGLYGEDSFWYESMKLYRQEKIEEWDTPLSKMKKDLKELLN